MFFVDALGWVMKICYDICGNYGVAIILFTLFSKIVLLPVSIWVQKNSIKMVKMQPEINFIKTKYFGDKDNIAEEQSKIYKKYKYNPFASLVPLIIQILLLLGVVEIVKNPGFYIGVENLDVNFLGFDLSWIAISNGGMAIWIPIIAGISAWILCVAQNAMNVLQAEQSKASQWGMMILSVGLSLYLGVFVTAGVALYWTASNLMAVLQQWLLNIFIDPKKYVDYEALEASRRDLKELQDLSKNNRRTIEQIKKEKADYKKFFSVVNKKLVFYSENNGFYKYFKGMIEYILKYTNLTIHYITSDYNDKIFELAKTEKHIKPYYIEEKKLITLMMKMDADVVVMTMPDIENYHIKRSYVRKDIEYIWVPHGIDSNNLTQRTGSMAHYDTVFAAGPYQKKELVAENKVYDLKDRKIFECGYPLFDDMLKDYEKSKKMKKDGEKKTIMIAPSWQKDNIIDLCLDKILKVLDGKNYNVIVRPHPQQVRHMKEYFNKMKEKYNDSENITIQTDFSNTSSVFDADLLISDWSGISFEYAFTTKRPVISVNTPMKVMNPEYKKIGVEPQTIWARKIIGETIEVKDIKNIDALIKKLLRSSSKYEKQITELVDDSLYNIGKSGKIGAKYIIDCVQNKIKERSKK